MTPPAQASATKTRRFHYVLSTHWDREWYEPFQYYRHRLVALLDQVIDGLEDGTLRGPFQTDGQAVLLDDYLEVRPERKEQVERLAKEGKFVIGPWFVLPDEFLVSGESHIRNIRMGREVARRYGTEPSNAGFICDLFGHISQMPQIFAGFGISGGFLWRGINLDHTRHVIWTGADGSEMVCYHFCNMGYSDFAFQVRDAHRHDVPYTSKNSRKQLDTYMDEEVAESDAAPILLFDGGDHQEWDQNVYKTLTKKMDDLKKDKNANYELIHSDLDIYLKELIADKKSIKTRLEGELREPGKTNGKACHQIPGVMSSRVWIKQRNRNCENMLTLWAEPMAALAHKTLGVENPHGFLQVAWRHLLENHPHDSICGCSVDTVHEDMKFRFSQTEQIAERLTMDATRRITASVGEKIDEDKMRIGLFNPQTTKHSGPIEVTVDVPTEWSTFNEFFGFEPKPSFRLFDDKGKEVPYHRLGQTMKRKRSRIRWERFPEFYEVNEVRIALDVEIPTQGYITLEARSGKENELTRHKEIPGLVRGHRIMQNEYIRVEIEPSGTVSMTDLENGETYEGMLAFEDCADIGDGWYHGVAVNDKVFNSQSCGSQVTVIENTSLTAAISIRTEMHLPDQFEPHGMVRSERLKPFVIETTLRLRKGQRHVECHTKLRNTVADHRLRVLFPSHAAAKTYYTDTPFDVIERKIGVREDNHEYMELEVETSPQQHFTAVYGKNGRGLGVVAKGLMEACVTDSEEKTVALTLLRSTRRTVNTDGEPEGLLLDWDLDFEYAITPFKGPKEFSRLIKLGQQIATDVRIVQMRHQDQEIYRTTDDKLPAKGGLLDLDGDVVLTSSRYVDGALEVRVFNPYGKATKGTLHCAGYKKCSLVDFESNKSGNGPSIAKGKMEFKLAPKQIQTFSLT